jgi:cyanophycinase-like exopeptidase
MCEDVAVPQPLQLSIAVPARRLVLIGGGEFSFGETREIDQFLLSQMPPDRRTVVFLPTASGSPEYALHIGRYFKELDSSVETVNVPIYRGRDNRRQKNLNAILSAGMVYLGGGVTNQLLATVHESAADIAMRDAAANGTVIAAIGAAASCFGLHVRDMRGVMPAIDGLGWLRETVVETGFDPVSDEALRRLMSLPDVRLGIGIPTSTALAIAADGTTQVIGGGNVVAFRKA